MQQTHTTGRLCQMHLNIFSRLGKNRGNPCQDTWQLYMSPCPLHVPSSTFLASLLSPAGLCFIHPVTPHKANTSLDTQTFVPSSYTSWPVLWPGLSKLYFSGRLLRDVHLSECTELHDQRQLLPTQMRNKLKRGKFGWNHPHRLRLSTWWMCRAHKILTLYLGFAAIHQHRHPCLLIYTNSLTLSCQCWKKTISACCFNHHVLEIAFQDCHGTMLIVKICLQSYILFYTDFTNP